MKSRNSLYMSTDPRQSWESGRIWKIPCQKVPISVISLQSRISSSPRGVTTSYFTRNRLRAVSFISGLLNIVGSCPDNSLTLWSHELSPRRDPRSDPSSDPAFGHPCAMRFDDFCTKNILAPTLVTFHWTARISDVETGYLQNRPTHGSCWVKWITLHPPSRWVPRHPTQWLDWWISSFQKSH